MPKGNNYQFEEGEGQANKEPLNPIELILFSQMIVKSWYNYSLKYHCEKMKSKNKNNNNDSLNNSCSSDVEEAVLQKLPIERKLEKRKGMLEANGQTCINYEFRPMPNIEEHYQNEKKRIKKVNNSANSKGLRVMPSSIAVKRFTSNSQQKTDNNQ